MKICHVNLASGFSGGERQTLQLIKQQLREGYQLTVVANPKSFFAKEVKKLNCALVLATHFIFQHKSSITDSCSIVHVHEGRAIYWALIQKKLFNTPYIITRRIDNPLKDGFLSALAYKNASALVGLSNEIVSKIKEFHSDKMIYKIPSSPVTYPVDQNSINSILNQFSGKFLVIQASNLLKHKGHSTTLKAAKILLETGGHNIHIVILGDGPEQDKLESEKTKKQLSNVTFVGKQSAMGNWFAAANLFIHPSYSEGLGSVILEAIQAGLPVIGSDAGGIPDIIDGRQSGLLVAPHNAEELAKAIFSVADNEPLHERLISGGQEKLIEFSIEKASQSYFKIYQRLIL